MFTATKPTPETIQGPYSAWPRRRISGRAKALATAAAALAAGGFVHCILPMLA